MEIKQNFKEFWDYVWLNHRGATLGVIIAFVLSLATLLLGFWRVLFIVLCVGIGFFVGKVLDENIDLRSRLLEFWNKFKKN